MIVVRPRLIQAPRAVSARLVAKKPSAPNSRAKPQGSWPRPGRAAARAAMICAPDQHRGQAGDDELAHAAVAHEGQAAQWRPGPPARRGSPCSATEPRARRRRRPTAKSTAQTAAAPRSRRRCAVMPKAPRVRLADAAMVFKCAVPCAFPLAVIIRRAPGRLYDCGQIRRREAGQPAVQSAKVQTGQAPEPRFSAQDQWICAKAMRGSRPERRASRRA